MPKDDFFEQGVFDVVFEVGVAFLEANFFANATGGLFKSFEISATEVFFEDGNNGDEDADEA